MKDTLIDVRDLECQISKVKENKEKMEATYWDGEPPRILYIKIRARNISYSVVPLKYINRAEMKTLKMKDEDLNNILQSIIYSVDAIIVEIVPTALKTMIEFRKRILQLREAVKVPFIMLESALPKSIVNGTEFRLYVDDIVPRGIKTGDLKDKIEVLKKLAHTKEVIAQVLQGDLELNHSKGKRSKAINSGLKRFVDIVTASGLLILLSPVMVSIVILVKLTSKGPVFYAAKRSGHNYKIFKFMKFRTMQVDADKKLLSMQNLNQYGVQGKNNPVFFKIKDDPRITSIGKFLRNTSLDELPQLFNVLKGDMSLVGNRPLPLYEARTLTTDQCVERFSAPAGITGLWQVKKRGAKEMSAQERIDLDIEYAQCYSLKNDVKIMFLTPKALIQKDNV